MKSKTVMHIRPDGGHYHTDRNCPLLADGEYEKHEYMEIRGESHELIGIIKGMNLLACTCTYPQPNPTQPRTHISEVLPDTEHVVVQDRTGMPRKDEEIQEAVDLIKMLMIKKPFVLPELTVCGLLILDCLRELQQRREKEATALNSFFASIRVPDEEEEFTDECFMPKVNGKPFRCECKCNVFHKIKGRDDIYICNACGKRYIGE